MKIESFLPIFNGFYNTLFECDCEGMTIEGDIEEGRIPKGTTYDNITWDYAEYNQRLSKACVGSIQQELDFDIKITFQELISPKWYNYSNDSINVEYELTQKVFDSIVLYLIDNKDEFEEYLEKYTSCSGFISFYSNNANVWISDYMKDENKFKHCFGSILDFILTNEEYDHSNLYDSIIDKTNYIDYELNQS